MLLRFFEAEVVRFTIIMGKILCGQENIFGKLRPLVDRSQKQVVLMGGCLRLFLSGAKCGGL